MPTGGTLFVSVNDADKPGVVPIARRFADLGFNLISTGGTHDALTAAGIESTKIHKIADEQSPNLKDYIDRDDLALILNTPTRKGSGTDEAKIRALAFRNHVPIVTTLTAGEAWAKAIAALREGDWQVKPLQAW
jgi:carbamoyl-phosphate synthase large subunit